MLQPKQLFISTLIILLLSCNSTYKQDEHTNLPASTKDTITAVLKRNEIKPGTTAIVERKADLFKITNTHKAVIAISDVLVQTSLVNDFKTIEQGFQDFVIDSNFDTTILCKEGTVFKIRHSSFLIASDSTEAEGPIKFQVKEFYKISDMLAARLATHSNDNILETAGMLFIQASSDGQLCKLKDNSAMEVSFPFTEKKEGMRLFSGSWTNQKINWELFQQNEPVQKDIVEEPATYPGGIVALNNFILKNLVYPDSLADMGIGGMVQIDFVIDETGKVKDVSFKSRSQKGFKDAILNTFLKMPRWKPAKHNGVPMKSTYSQSITFYNEGENINDSILKKDFEATNNDSNINRVKAADIRQYIFSTSKLGWINCDRFYNSPKPKTDFYVDCGNYTELDIRIVFHSFKAILDNFANKPISKFKSIPDNEAITVVVIKKINNETFISLTESNTNLKSINNLAFEKVTMGKLKQKLEQLSNAR